MFASPVRRSTAIIIIILVVNFVGTADPNNEKEIPCMAINRQVIFFRIPQLLNHVSGPAWSRSPSVVYVLHPYLHVHITFVQNSQMVKQVCLT